MWQQRRMALRLARERSALIEPDDAPDATVTQLPSVAKVLATTAADESVAEAAEPVAEMGDDDEADFDDLEISTPTLWRTCGPRTSSRCL